MEDKMTKSKYREIRKTEDQLNDRLLDFIIEKNDLNNFIYNLDIDKPPLDNWIINDYIKLNGTSYIDEFLELYSHSLDSLEIEILQQKSISYISIFEIVKISGNTILIEDKLNRKSYKITDDSIRTILLEGDHILARVAKIRGQYIFIGEVEYIPSSIMDEFYESILIYFNQERINNPNLEIKNFLKRYSLDIYSIYRECLADHMDEVEDDIPPIISDITDFQEYAIENFPKDYHIYMTNLMEIFEYKLADDDLSLVDINKIDLDDFFKEAIDDGFISSKDDFNLYLNSLKAYLKFLSQGNPDFRSSYNQIIEISSNRFKYMLKLKDDNFNYDYDRMLASAISNKLDRKSLGFIWDLDRFLIFAMEFEIELTKKKKKIGKKELLSINKLLNLSEPLTKSRPSQKDSKIINILYHLTLGLGLTRINDCKMLITDKGKNFFKLRDEEKYATAFSFIQKKYSSYGLADNLTDNLATFDPDLVDDLLLMNIVDYDVDFNIGFTSLGRLIFKYLINIKGQESKLINFEDYKEKKTKEV